MSDEEVVAFSRDQRMPKEGEPVCVVPPYRMIESRFVVNMERTYATKRKRRVQLGVQANSSRTSAPTTAN